MRSLPLAIAAAAAAVLLLGGCAPESTVDPSTAPTESTTGPSPTGTPQPDGSAAPAEPVAATPVSIGCNDLVDLQTVYDFNPNYGNQPDFTPRAGSTAATIAASNGTVCNWVNQTSGETFIVAVAQPSPDELGALKAAASSGSAASGVGDVAYFSTSGSMGEAQVFSGPYWLVASSAAFYDFETAQPLLTAAVSALGR